MDLAKELAALEKAEIDLVDADKRIQRQGALVEELRRDGHDIEPAVILLDTLKATRQAMSEHRDLIVRTIEDIRAGKFRSS